MQTIPTVTAPNVTSLLARASAGDQRATNELLPLVYDELRGLAAQHLECERAGHTLQPTALVHEVYLRMVGPGDVTWQNRAHFFGAAATAIRRVLTDHARSRGRQKRGGNRLRLPLEAVDLAVREPDVDLLVLDEALDRLAAIDPAKAKVVELRYFAGLSVKESARVLGVSEPTVCRYWEFARVWLYRELSSGPTA